jgi:excisionase family DNA binding protein
VTEQLMTARELADYLGVAYDWVIDKWEAGEIPGFRLGHRTLRFRRSEIDAWMESKRRGPTPASRSRLRAVGSS